MNDIALEVDVPFGRADGIEPRRVILSRVFEQSNMITFNERRTGGAREGLVGECAHLRHGVVLTEMYGGIQCQGLPSTIECKRRMFDYPNL